MTKMRKFHVVHTIKSFHIILQNRFSPERRCAHDTDSRIIEKISSKSFDIPTVSSGWTLDSRVNWVWEQFHAYDVKGHYCINGIGCFQHKRQWIYFPVSIIVFVLGVPRLARFLLRLLRSDRHPTPTMPSRSSSNPDRRRGVKEYSR